MKITVDYFYSRDFDLDENLENDEGKKLKDMSDDEINEFLSSPNKKVGDLLDSKLEDTHFNLQQWIDWKYTKTK